MNNKQVAHVWASQNRESGKGSNFYFEGPTIYSYGPHFPIAVFTDRHDAGGCRVVLFNSGSYSMSTARHMSYAASALYGLDVRVIRVPYPSACASDHARNVRHFVELHNAAMLKASTARKYAASYLADAEKAQADCADYCAIFEQPAPDMLADAVSPELAQQLRAKAKEDARKAAEKEAQRIAAEAIEYAKRAELWRAGASAHELELWRFAGHDTLLRIVGDKVETSRGAEIPVSAARMLWALVQHAPTRSDEQRAAIVRACPRVGDFQLREVRADGSIVVGCHTLTRDEIARAGGAL